MAALLALGCSSATDSSPTAAASPLQSVDSNSSSGARPTEIALSGTELDPLDVTEPSTRPYRMPGEYEEIDRVLIGWEQGNWAYLEVFEALARLVVTDQVALTLVGDADDTAAFRDYLEEHGVAVGRITALDTPLNSMWIRDYGPVYVRDPDGDLAVIDLPYHQDRLGDDGMPSMVAAREGRRLYPLKVPIEGGHLLSDGSGRCIVSSDVLYLADEEGLDADTVRLRLRQAFGCDDATFVDPLVDEETGHVDVFAAIPSPGHVLVGRYRAFDDPVNRVVLDAVAAQLREAGFEVERIPMPANRGRHLFRTYTNVVVLNHSVLVPVYGAARHFEAEALTQLEHAFGRPTIPVEAEPMMELAGAIHCITRTVPAATRSARVHLPPAIEAPARRPNARPLSVTHARRPG